MRNFHVQSHACQQLAMPMPAEQEGRSRRTQQRDREGQQRPRLVNNGGAQVQHCIEQQSRCGACPGQRRALRLQARVGGYRGRQQQSLAPAGESGNEPCNDGACCGHHESKHPERPGMGKRPPVSHGLLIHRPALVGDPGKSRSQQAHDGGDGDHDGMRLKLGRKLVEQHPRSQDRQGRADPGKKSPLVRQREPVVGLFAQLSPCRRSWLGHK